jgi:branched-chain amino acid transport system permease protein
MYESISNIIFLSILEGSIYALLGLSISIIAGVTKITSMVHGDLIVLSGYVSFWLYVLANIDPFVSLIITAPLMFFLGVALEKLLSRSLLTAQAPLVTTYALSLFIMSLELALWTSNYRIIMPTYALIVVKFLGTSTGLMKLVSFIIAFSVTFFAYFLIKKTRFGEAVRAVSEDKLAASLMGINPEKIYVFVFGVSGVITALAGVAYATTHVIYPGLGILLILRMYAVVVLGGMGSILGCFLGGLSLAIIENIGSFFLGGPYINAVAFIYLIVVLMLLPKGIIGKGAEL